MYQNQFVSLTQQLQQHIQPTVSLNVLLNNGDKRSKLLQQASTSGDRKLELLAKRIVTLEDLSPQRMRVDCLPLKVKKSKNPWHQMGVMVLFALTNMGLITGAIIAYEGVKSGRIQSEQRFLVQAINNQKQETKNKF